jgi:hypothetical protein
VAFMSSRNPVPAGLPLSASDSITAPAATATAAVMMQARGAYIDPKLIGPDYRLERVNEGTECGPPAGTPLPENCNGKWWRSFNVISESRGGTHVSQTIKQFPKDTSGASQMQNEIDTIKRVNPGKTFTETPINTPLPGSILLARDDQDQIRVISPKDEYLASVIIYGKKDSNEQATQLATRVLTLLLERIPDRLGGPVPNPEYWGNKYWEIK